MCRLHGGSAPQVKAKAEERLLALIDPALVRLRQLLEQTEFPSTAYQAVRDILDRNGQLGKPRETVQATVTARPDLSRLSEAELAQLEALLSRAMPGCVDSA